MSVKKGLAGIMAVSVAVTVLSVPVLADNSSSYTVTRTVEATNKPYTWNMPTAIKWSAVEGDAGIGLYEAEAKFNIRPIDGEKYIILAPGKTLNVKIDSANADALTAAGTAMDSWGVLANQDFSNTLKYNAYDSSGTVISGSDPVASIACGSDDTAGMDVKVTFKTTAAARIADTYSDFITFTVSIDDAVTTAEENAAPVSDGQATTEATPIAVETPSAGDGQATTEATPATEEDSLSNEDQSSTTEPVVEEDLPAIE